MFNGAQNEGEAVMEKTMCVCMHACVQSHVNDMAPLRRWDMAGEATGQKQLFLAAITASRSMLPAWKHSARGATLGTGTQGSVLGCGGAGEGNAPAAELPSSSARRHGGGLERGALLVIGSTKQGQASHHTSPRGCAGRRAVGPRQHLERAG